MRYWVGPREIYDISRHTIKLSLETGAILTFLKVKKGLFSEAYATSKAIFYSRKNSEK